MRTADCTSWICTLPTGNQAFPVAAKKLWHAVYLHRMICHHLTLRRSRIWGSHQHLCTLVTSSSKCDYFHISMGSQDDLLPALHLRTRGPFLEGGSTTECHVELWADLPSMQNSDFLISEKLIWVSSVNSELSACTTIIKSQHEWSPSRPTVIHHGNNRQKQVHLLFFCGIGNIYAHIQRL